MPTNTLACDGCGQLAAPEHIAWRLRRLEWTTRYRPVHISALLLGGVSPPSDEDFLYAGKFEGEAGRLLDAVGISHDGKGPEAVLSEFQRGGFFLAHVLECPLEPSQAGQPSRESLLLQRTPAVIKRIRRSLKPKRVILISDLLAQVATRLSSGELGCPVVLDEGQPFGLDSPNSSRAIQHLGQALGKAAAGL